jgi:hypothetical protein
VEPHLKWGYMPWLHVFTDSAFRPVTSTDKTITNDIVKHFQCLFENPQWEAEVLAMSSCGSDLMNLLSYWCQADGKECLQLSSAGGRGEVGYNCVMQSKTMRKKRRLSLTENFLDLYPKHDHFMAALQSDVIHTPLLDYLERKFHAEPIGIVLLELAPVYKDTICITGGTLKAILTLCHKHGVALFIDDVMLNVRCGKFFSFEYVKDFMPDGVIIGSKVWGMGCIIGFPQSAFSKNATWRVNHTGQEVPFCLTERCRAIARYLLKENILSYIRTVGETQRRVQGASGLGYFWTNINHFTITSLHLQSFYYQWDFCPERVLLPLDYKF